MVVLARLVVARQVFEPVSVIVTDVQPLTADAFATETTSNVAFALVAVLVFVTFIVGVVVAGFDPVAWPET
jgi:hypothetical protein